MKTSWRWCGLLIASLFIGGCQTAAPKVQTPIAVTKPAPVISAQVLIDRQVERLLWQAERALSADRLMSPDHDNAYDRYRAVLLLRPASAQARSGLQQVLIRYIQLGRQALAHSQLPLAREYVARAALVDADNALLKEFRVALAQAQARNVNDSAANEFPLEQEALDRRDSESLAVIERVAHRVKVSDEALLIIARNDAEGRWVYQQMRKAAEGYRIRGDIQIGAAPKIVVYPPIQ